MGTDHSGELAVDAAPSTEEFGPLTIARIRPAYRQVADQLRTNIVTGVLIPGQRLPIEPELAKVWPTEKPASGIIMMPPITNWSHRFFS